MMFWSSWALMAIMATGENSLPQWLHELNPSASMRFRWTERREDISNVSSPSLLAQAGLFPNIKENLKLGLEISTYQNAGPSPSSVWLSNGMSNKSIGLRQAFLDAHFGSSIKWTGIIGKFQSPVFASPFLWDSERTPEGIFQNLSFQVSRDFQFTPYAAQYSVDQNSSSSTSSLRRSWLFQQGFSSQYQWSSDTDLTFSLNHFHFYKPSGPTAELSAPLGNSFVGSAGSRQFRYQYSPVEFILAASANPLGIRTSILGSVAVNLRTPDQQRAFFIESTLGNKWRARHFWFSLSYYYNEPDTSIGYFADSIYANANRKAARTEIAYFILDNLRTSICFLYANVLQSSYTQSLRKEALADLEIVF